MIFLGDSTIMRDYIHLRRGSTADYTTKVAALNETQLESTVTLSSGRKVRLVFIRLLHVALCREPIDAAFAAATPRTLIMITIGPHDTSWLTFRRPMPGMRRSLVGHWSEARKYWQKHVTQMAQVLGWHLQRYELARATPGNATTVAAPRRPKRPIVLFREQYLPNCAHPKYAKYPLITRCPDLLRPIVVPQYRSFAAAAFGWLAIPVIRMDPLMPPCYLYDAGHIVRWCKRFEIGMAIAAYRTARRAGVVQGFAPRCRRASCQTVQRMLRGNKWADLLGTIEKTPVEGSLALDGARSTADLAWSSCDVLPSATVVAAAKVKGVASDHNDTALAEAPGPTPVALLSGGAACERFSSATGDIARMATGGPVVAGDTERVVTEDGEGGAVAPGSGTQFPKANVLDPAESTVAPTALSESPTLPLSLSPQPSTAVVGPSVVAVAITGGSSGTAQSSTQPPRRRTNSNRDSLLPFLDPVTAAACVLFAVFTTAVFVKHINFGVVPRH